MPNRYYEYPEGVAAEIWEQELSGGLAMQSLFALVRKRFRELERSEGLTKTALAERMGLTQAQVSRWLSSPNNMTIRTAGKLLCAMGRKLELRVSDPYAPLSADEITRREELRKQYVEDLVEVDGHMCRIPRHRDDPPYGTGG